MVIIANPSVLGVHIYAYLIIWKYNLTGKILKFILKVIGSIPIAFAISSVAVPRVNKLIKFLFSIK